MLPIVPNLWIDDQTESAVEFYVSLFKDSKILKRSYFTGVGEDVHGKGEGELMVISFELAGERFAAINGGPFFKFTPAASLFVTCESAEEVDRLWEQLSSGGNTLMPLDKYPWSERYGWVQDRFGLTWQLYLGKLEDVGQKISFNLLFNDHIYGKAEEAIEFYESVFNPFKNVGILRYGKNEEGEEGTVKHAQFEIHDRVFMAMDSPLKHGFTFNESVSFLIECETQGEIDYFWDKLSEGGDPEAQRCGWLKDKYGVSWQICPKILFDLISDYKSESAKRVMESLMKMRKLDIETLKKVAKD